MRLQANEEKAAQGTSSESNSGADKAGSAIPVQCESPMHNPQVQINAVDNGKLHTMNQLSALSSNLEQLIHTLHENDEVQAEKPGGDITAGVWSEVINVNDNVLNLAFNP